MRRLVKVLRDDTGTAPATPSAPAVPASTTPVAGLAEIRELTERSSRTGPPVLLTVESGLEERHGAYAFGSHSASCSIGPVSPVFSRASIGRRA
ncbi:hypothetical protein ACN6AT_26665 [Streptomyces sp. JL4002]|uniref:hypothetical protein n=1 Tax=Streptomyces TaxID=1883 RepID=UPI003B27FE81